MKNHFKHSILIALTLLITLGLVYAQPTPIGQTVQAQPFESNPTAVSTMNVEGGDGIFGNERDGILGTSVNIRGISTAASGIVYISGFTVPAPADQFPIAWVDIKIKYKHPATSDDGYSIAYLTSGTLYLAWLQSTVSSAAAKFDKDGNPAVRPWSNMPTYPDTGAWTWADVSSFSMRIIVMRGGNAVWNDFFELYEVWLTIYSSVPPSSSTALSLMPPSMLGLPVGSNFFVDVYLNGYISPPGLWGYQATIKYDESKVTALEWFTYWPFVTANPSAITPGVVSVSYVTFGGDTVGFLGESTPLCRIYFEVDAGGGSTLDLIDDRTATPPLFTEIADVAGNTWTPPLYDSWAASPHIMSFNGGILPPGAPPAPSSWHELYPQYCQTWTLTSWIDNDDSILSPSDQIDMEIPGWLYWFHVDKVTITIHFTFKPDLVEEGSAEPTTPMETLPDNPIGSEWHMIYPTYCKIFKITSWEDNDGSGTFNPSDQFDFEFTPYDVVLAGDAPPADAPLTAPGPTNSFHDADYSGTWDVGEAAVDDLDYDTMYSPEYMGMGLDVLLVGPEPGLFDPLSPPGVNDKFWDADSSGTWDVGEPAIRDIDGDGIYAPQETIWAHLDEVTTDIWVSQKGEPEPTEPEFPLGIGILIAFAPMIAIVYVWRLRKRSR